MITAVVSDRAITWNGRPKHAPIEFADLVVKGFTRVHLAGLFAKSGFTKGAEIGVADGRYSLTLCRNIPNLELLCVDPWAPYKGNRRGGPVEQHERNFRLAQERLSPYRVDFWRMMSYEAALCVEDESLDVVYIDANHDFPYVLSDLRAWEPKVRPGGIVAGHDFYGLNHSGVVEAVVAFTGSRRITGWHVCDEREPSFWWVKP